MLFFLFFLSANLIFGSGMKANNLTILVLLPITGDEPRNGEACKVGSEIVLNEINSRIDILPNYHVNAIYRDEGPGGNLSPAAAVQFVRMSETTDIAPIVVGPFFSGGCVALAKYVQHIDMVQVSMACSTPQATAQRRLFPNLYRIRVTGEVVAYSQLSFIRHAGKWKRFGILTNAGNVFDYSIAIYLQKVANQEGFEVSYFDCVPNIDDHAMQMLKESDTRVIVVDISVAGLITQFLCQSFKFGLTGAKYAFILHAGGFFEPASLPPVVGSQQINCSREVIWEQLKYSFWIAWSLLRDSKAELKTSLGYNFAQFEEKFDGLTTHNRPGDYDKRALCHDSVLQAVMALDSAEKKLLEEKNLSLKDYRNYPHEVMSAVNESMANVDYVGLRVGPFQYSKRLEFDNDTMVAFQWTPPNSKVILSQFRHDGDVRSLYNFSNYKIRELEKPKWFTEKKAPPRDKLLTVEYESHIPNEFVWFVIAMASFSSLLQVVGLIYRTMRKLEKTSVVKKIGKILSILGCLVLNGAAIAFAIPVELSAVCSAQRILAVLGYTFLTVYILSSVTNHHQIAMSSSALFHSKTASAFRRFTKGTTRNTMSVLERDSRRVTQVSQSSQGHVPLEAPPNKALKPVKNKWALLTGTMLISGFPVAYLIAWLFVEQPDVEEQNDRPSLYNVRDDIMSVYRVDACKGNGAAWAMPQVAYQLALLAVAALIAYDVRRKKAAMPNDSESGAEFNGLWFAIANLLTLSIGILLLVAILSSPIQQGITISTFGLIISVTTGGILLKFY